jgi:hypothetical protein
MSRVIKRPRPVLLVRLGRGVKPHEFFEEVGKLFLAKSPPFVPDFELKQAVLFFKPKPHPSPFVPVLQCIVQKVAVSDFQKSHVAENRYRIREVPLSIVTFAP